MALTIRLTEKEEILINRLKKLFTEKSSSKALLKAAEKVFEQKKLIDELTETINTERQKNEELIEIIYKCEQILNQERTLTDQLVILRQERKKMLDDLQSFFDAGGS